MAIFIFIVPKNEVTKKYGNIPTYLDEDFLESFTGWEEFQLSDITSLLVEGFGIEKLLSYGPTIFGAEESSSIQLLFDENILEDVSVRLDLRSQIQPQIGTCISLCNKLNGIIVDSNYTVIGSTREELISAIKSSPSMKFVRDPKGFLNSLSSKR